MRSRWNWTILLTAALLLTGCAEWDMESPGGPSGMKRTLTTRDASGETKTSQREYPRPSQRERQPPEQRTSWLDRQMSPQYAPPVPADPPIPTPPVPKAPEQESTSTITSLPLVSSSSAGGYEPQFTRMGPFGGAMNLRLWTKLTTRFNSPSFSNLSWTESPRLSAPGWEGGWSWGDKEEPGSFFMRLGLFQDQLAMNIHNQGATFVREDVSLHGGYLEGGLDYVVWDWMRLEGSLGGFYYHVRTSVDTNAPSFAYEGVLGSRLLGIVGFGAGVETPWSFPVRLYAGGRLYLPFNPFGSDEDLLEKAFGEGNAGMRWRF